jgi:ACR3 family arsenite efflux pump ArsB
MSKKCLVKVKKTTIFRLKFQDIIIRENLQITNILQSISQISWPCSSIAHFSINSDNMKLSVAIFASAFGLASAASTVVSRQMLNFAGAFVVIVEWRAG